jgi:hypothetical protein
MNIARFDILVSALLCLGLYHPPANAISIGFQPVAQTVNLAGNINVDVVISGLSSAQEIVSAFDLAVSYGPGIINAVSVSFGTGLGDLSAFEAVSGDSLSAGRIEFFENSFFTDAQLLALPQPDSFILATLSFNTLAAGTATLQFDPIVVPGNVLYPGINVVGLNFSNLTLDNISTSSVTVQDLSSQVPSPDALWLIIIGLIGLVTRQTGSNQHRGRGNDSGYKASARSNLPQSYSLPSIHRLINWQVVSQRISKSEKMCVF